MNKKIINFETKDLKVVDGRIVVSSDELANAIGDQTLHLDEAEEAGVQFGNCFCNGGSVAR